jgi:hypothetical protein
MMLYLKLLRGQGHVQDHEPDETLNSCHPHDQDHVPIPALPLQVMIWKWMQTLY